MSHPLEDSRRRRTESLIQELTFQVARKETAEVGSLCFGGEGRNAIFKILLGEVGHPLDVQVVNIPLRDLNLLPDADRDRALSFLAHGFRDGLVLHLGREEIGMSGDILPVLRQKMEVRGRGDRLLINPTIPEAVTKLKR